MSLNQRIGPDFPQPPEPLLGRPTPKAASCSHRLHLRGPPAPPALALALALPKYAKARELATGESKTQGRTGRGGGGGD